MNRRSLGSGDQCRVAVHFDSDAGSDNFCHRWEKYLQETGVEVRRVDLLGATGLEQLADCDGLMWHWYHTTREKRAAPLILTAIESVMRMPVFPNQAARWHFDEKLAQYYLFKASGVATVPTWVFWDRDTALESLADADYPLVFKLSTGASSSGVRLLEGRQEAQRLATRLFEEGLTADELPAGAAAEGHRKPPARLLDRANWAVRYLLTGRHPPRPMKSDVQRGYLYVQKFLPGNTHDIRVTVIGHRAFGYVRHNRAGDFRASGSGDFDVDPVNIPMGAVANAHALSSRLGFDCMTYDFLRDDEGSLLVNEISYGFVNWMVARCPGYWDRDLAWHAGASWPEQAQVEDFLGRIRQASGS